MASSFIPVPAGSDFPLGNLPLGAVVRGAGGRPSLAVALGDSVVDLKALHVAGLLSLGGPVGDGACFTHPTANAFLDLGPDAWALTRAALTRLLTASEGVLRDKGGVRDAAILGASTVSNVLPMAVGDYTDFYCSRVHAQTCGELFRDPEAALNPNWSRLPVGYGGRASSVAVSGTPIARPHGQMAPAEPGGTPRFGPTAKLDFELEFAAVVGGPPNARGAPVPVDAAAARVYGYVLMNDWSARDVQAWESVPLGPFVGKSFATTVSPWIVAAAALAPHAAPGPPQDPAPLAYLDERARTLPDVALTAEVVPAGRGARAATTVTESNVRHLYWTFPQMLAHHTVGGCVLRAGDLVGSGTVSAPGARGAGCLLEATADGARPLALRGGGSRTWLLDGDEVVLRGRCAAREGVEGLGFGCARGVVVARASARERALQ